MAHMEARSGPFRYVGSERSEMMPFYVEMAGVDHCTADYSLTRSHATLSVVGYTVAGAGTVKQNGKAVTVGPGDLFFVTSEDSHTYAANGSWSFYWVNLRGDEWRGLLDRYGLGDLLAVSDFPLGAAFVSCIRAVTEGNPDLQTWQLEMQGLLYRMVLALYEIRRTAETRTLGETIRSAFASQPGIGLTQAEICRSIGITPRHAQRVFRQTYGISIHQFLTARQLQQAKALLSGTGSSIAEVAAALGFANEKYFSTFFRRHAGMTPSAYRAAHSHLGK